MNTDQKLPAESAGERPSTPLFGHAISHAATLIGLFAIVLWGFMAGLVRLVSESFGATLGSALVYTVGGVMLFIVRRPKPIREAPRKYLIAGGLMFIAYEASISLSIGLATTNAQSVEVSLVNYLWPTLLVLMTAAVSHKRGAVAKAIPGAVIATIGVAMAVGGESLDMQEAVHNIASNPLPYVLAFVGAFIWAIYATFTPSLSGGYDGTTDFLLLCGRCTVDHPFRFGRRFAGHGARHRWICCADCVRRFDFGRLRVLGIRHVARQYGNACDWFVRDSAVFHGF